MSRAAYQAGTRATVDREKTQIGLSTRSLRIRRTGSGFPVIPVIEPISSSSGGRPSSSWPGGRGETFARSIQSLASRTSLSFFASSGPRSARAAGTSRNRAASA